MGIVVVRLSNYFPNVRTLNALPLLSHFCYARLLGLQERAPRLPKGRVFFYKCEVNASKI